MNTLGAHMLLLVYFILLTTFTLHVRCQKPEFLINCGLDKSTNLTSALDNRVWVSDDDPAFLSLNINNVSIPVHTPNNGDDVPYTTTRFFRSPLTYLFPVSPGPKFLRLYFSPSATYNEIPVSQLFVSLRANGATLLRNFCPYLNSQTPSCGSANSDPPVYEFHLLLDQNIKFLNLTFSPGSNSDKETTCKEPCYGFINGIEIVPVPEDLYVNKTKTYTSLSNPEIDYFIENITALQTVYRLNVGGATVSPANDSGFMGRSWHDVNNCISGSFPGATTYSRSESRSLDYIKFSKVPAYTAPKLVYASQRYIGLNLLTDREKTNLTWGFEVDAGFDYLVRLHLCENDLQDNGTNSRVFLVYLNDQTDDKSVDVWSLAGGRRSPAYTEYIVRVDANKGTTGKAPLTLVLQPVRQSWLVEVLLNGLEILKLNDPAENLAAPNPPLLLDPTRSVGQNTPDSKRSNHQTRAIIGGILGGVAIVSLLSLAWLINLYRRKVKKRASTSSRTSTNPSKGIWVPTSALNGSTNSTINSSLASLPKNLCRRFTIEQMRISTCDFDEGFVIGTGGFGKVYKGSIDNGATSVAVKRLNPLSKQGAQEFRTEIEMLSRLRHLHLVSLIGYCDDQGEMILVYEYMPHGTLRDHLMYKSYDNNSNIVPLSWKQRLMICVGSARGLHYLHSGNKEVIIHRDVKSTNILLDEKWTAKVSDFGLSKVGPASESGIGHVSTVVKGSFGYLDPEYYKCQRLTVKSDVYSFGVVLFEVLCGRAAACPNLPKDQVNLAPWARKHYEQGTLHTIIDPNLKGQIAPECLRKFAEIADMCVRNQGSERPSMADVVWGLEFSLKLQETSEKTNIDGYPLDEMPGDNSVRIVREDDTKDNDMFSSNENLSQVTDGGTPVPRVRLENSGMATTISSATSASTIDHQQVFSQIFDQPGR